MKALSHYHSKAEANVQVFPDKPRDRPTGQKLYAPDLLIWGCRSTKVDKKHSPTQTHLLL